MAQLDGMLIADPSRQPVSGAAFLLANPARETAAIATSGPWTVEVHKGSRYVVANGAAATSYDSAWREAYEAIEKGLDLLDITGATIDLDVRDAAREYMTWWIEKGQVVLRTVCTVRLTVDLAATGIVTDAAGHIINQPAPSPPTWHSSFRYFRLSQVTDDATEAYRNLWLALESVLETITPKRIGEGENTWLRRALVAAAGIVSLDQLVPGSSPASAAMDAYKYFYQGQRNAIFHAKPSFTPLLPRSLEPRPALLEALERLGELYLALAALRLGAQRPRSGITLYGFRLMMDPFEQSTVITVTDDPSEFDANATAVNPSGGQIVALDTRRAPEMDQPFVQMFLGSKPGSDMGGLGPVTRIVAAQNGNPMWSNQLEGRLTLDGLLRFEAALGIALRSAHRLKTAYLT